MLSHTHDANLQKTENIKCFGSYASLVLMYNDGFGTNLASFQLKCVFIAPHSATYVGNGSNASFFNFEGSYSAFGVFFFSIFWFAT